MPIHTHIHTKAPRTLAQKARTHYKEEEHIIQNESSQEWKAEGDGAQGHSLQVAIHVEAWPHTTPRHLSACCPEVAHVLDKEPAAEAPQEPLGLNVSLAHPVPPALSIALTWREPEVTGPFICS